MFIFIKILKYSLKFLIDKRFIGNRVYYGKNFNR